MLRWLLFRGAISDRKAEGMPCLEPMDTWMKFGNLMHAGAWKRLAWKLSPGFYS